MEKSKTRYRALITFGAAIAAAALWTGIKADRAIHMGAAYKAKIACSEIFLAERDPAAVLKDDFANIDPFIERMAPRIDIEKKTVTAAGPFGLGRANAVYRPSHGCTLVSGGRVRPVPTLEPIGAVEPWPAAPPLSGNALHQIDYAALDVALTQAIEDDNAGHRALLVAIDGKIVGERYADGFTKDTPFLSWSMGKSVTATLVGAAVQKNIFAADDPAAIAEWRGGGRAHITWNNLLHMQSGLEFEEDYYDPRSDVNRMLFEAADAGAVASGQKVTHEPGKVWAYSSGTTNIIAKALREVITDNGGDYINFGRNAVFQPIGAASFVLEPDASGTMIGSSFVYATARDWARLGQLYLQDGIWNNVRILPEGWANYVATPAGASDNQFGAHFWLNLDGKEGRARFVPGLPENVYYMSGHEGQYVFMIPSKRMLIVRTGVTRGVRPITVMAPLAKDIFDAVEYSPSDHSP